MRSGLITLAQLTDVPLFDRYRRVAEAEHPHLVGADMERRLLYETIRRMLSAQVYDVIEATRAALQDAAPRSVAEVRLAGALVHFSAPMRAQSSQLKRFLFTNLYRHPQVVETTGRAQRMVTELFAAYMAEPREMKPRFTRRAMEGEPSVRARAVADFIAGMTDRFAGREHERLTGLRLLG